jgi:hypothetical protein
MSDQHDSPEAEAALDKRDRRILTAVIVALLGTATCFRLMSLSSVPGISGDEGWWGVQAIAWLSGRPYEAHTTSGNPIDLFFLVPLALAHAVAPPSFLLLRIVPTFLNLLALPIGFWFVRRLYGTTTAWTHTVGLAIMPTAIAHGRICQDPSQSIFWTSIVIYLSLLGLEERGRAWIYCGAALLIFPVALWTHPTNVFIAPFVVLPFVAAVRPLLPASRRGRTILLVVATLLLTLGLSIAGLTLRPLSGANQYLDQPWLAMASARMTDGAQWFEFAANNARLFNGVTIYHYFSGARPPTFPYDAGFVVVVVAALWGFLLMPAARRTPLDYRLIFACTTMWVGFYAFAGPQALRPHFERWGLCLIAPGTLVLARGLTAWIERTPRTRWLTIAASTLVATSLLGSFYANYFEEFATTGGRSHLTYVTAATEPKQQALEHILARSAGPDRVAIVTQQWWLVWPIAYLATEHPNVSVSMGLDVERQAGFSEALHKGRLFFVEFVGTPERAAAIDWIRKRGFPAARTTIRDASGRELLEVLQVTAAR